MDTSTFASLTRLLGSNNIRTDDESRRRALSAWSPPAAEARQILPAAVAFPADSGEVSALVQWANETKTPLYPAGGSSNIVNSGPAGSGEADANVVAVDLSRLDTIRWDEEALLVHAGAGLNLGVMEERLNAHEYTLGHFPGSLNLLTVGGATAMDAIGPLSGRYGRQCDLTMALTVVLPSGEIVHTAAPPLGSAAFDLHRLFIGSEGAFGIVTEATFAMRPLPEARAWAVFSFAKLDDSIDALRLIYRSDSRPACTCLLDPEAARELIARHDTPQEQPLLLLAFEGDELAQTGPYQLAHAVCQQVGGQAQSAEIGEEWLATKRSAAGFLSHNAHPGGVAGILALSAAWPAVKPLSASIQKALAMDTTKVSLEIGHAGPQGAALEVAFEAQAGSSSDAALLQDRIIDAALRAARENGAAVAHHFGVGNSSRRRFLADERGESGVTLLSALKVALDPNGILPRLPFSP